MKKYADVIGALAGAVIFFTLAQAMSPMHFVESLIALGFAALAYWRISKYLKTK